MKNYYKIVLVNIIIFVLLLLALEITARIGIKVLRGYSTVGLKERTLNLRYQPYVMFGNDWEKKYENIKEKKNFRILIIGGSTAEGWFPSTLEDVLYEKYDLKVKVFNSAHGAYNVRQQLVGLAIWGGRINPDIVISLDGANDILHSIRGEVEEGTFFLNNTYKTYLTKPYLSTFIYFTQNSQLYNGLKRLMRRRVDLKKEDSLKNVHLYLEAKNNISLISEAIGAHHISVLQPYLGFKKNMTEKEKNFKIYNYRDKVVKELFNYTEINLEKLYKSSNNTTHFNSQNLFNLDQRIFSDDFHFSDNYGYELLSEKIGEILIKKELFR
tara:strand:- start:378 stop:1355 length:978 start_codon:yes stop_codon:yes gene_type:complete